MHVYVEGFYTSCLFYDTEREKNRVNLCSSATSLRTDWLQRPCFRGMRPTKFSFKVKSSNISVKNQSKVKYHHGIGRSYRQQKLDATKLQIPAKINAFSGWKPNTLFRPSEFAGKPLPLHQRPKRLDPIERKHLIDRKLEAKQKRYGNHVSSPFEIRDDHSYEKMIKFDSNFCVEPGDSANGAFMSQRGCGSEH